MNDVPQLGTEFVTKIVQQLNRLRGLAERAMGQIDDEQFFAMPTPESTSIATNVQHIAGNMKSRWTNFLTTDGEKSWRQRDTEFVPSKEDRSGLMARWNASWSLTLETISALEPGDLLTKTAIRSEYDVVLQRILRQLGHYSYHVGQIVYVARMHAGNEWKSLSIPLGGSDAFNASMDHDTES